MSSPPGRSCLGREVVHSQNWPLRLHRGSVQLRQLLGGVQPIPRRTLNRLRSRWPSRARFALVIRPAMFTADGPKKRPSSMAELLQEEELRRLMQDSRNPFTKPLWSAANPRTVCHPLNRLALATGSASRWRRMATTVGESKGCARGSLCCELHLPAQSFVVLTDLLEKLKTISFPWSVAHVHDHAAWRSVSLVHRDQRRA